MYQLDMNPNYLPLTDHIFAWLERPTSRAVTSILTMTELLVQPYRALDEERVDAYYALLSTHPNLEWLAPNLEVADIAARFRAQHRLHTPNPLQAATAVHANATALLTNDPIFKRVPDFDVLVLDEYL